MNNKDKISTLKIYVPSRMRKEIGDAFFSLGVEQFKDTYYAEKFVKPSERDDSICLRFVNQIITTLKTGDTKGHLLFENKYFVYKNNGCWFHRETNEECFDLQDEISYWLTQIKNKMKETEITTPSNRKLTYEEKLKLREQILANRETELHIREIKILDVKRKLEIATAEVDTKREQVKANKLKAKSTSIANTKKAKELKEKKRKLNKLEEENHKLAEENQRTEALNQKLERLLQSDSSSELEASLQEEIMQLTKGVFKKSQQSSLALLERLGYFQSSPYNLSQENQESSSTTQRTLSLQSSRAPNILKERPSRNEQHLIRPEGPKLN